MGVYDMNQNMGMLGFEKDSVLVGALDCWLENIKDGNMTRVRKTGVKNFVDEIENPTIENFPFKATISIMPTISRFTEAGQVETGDMMIAWKSHPTEGRILNVGDCVEHDGISYNVETFLTEMEAMDFYSAKIRKQR